MTLFESIPHLCRIVVDLSGANGLTCSGGIAVIHSIRSEDSDPMTPATAHALFPFGVRRHVGAIASGLLGLGLIVLGMGIDLSLPPMAEATESIIRNAKNVSFLFMASGLVIILYGLVSACGLNRLRHRRAWSALGLLLVVGLALVMFADRVRATKCATFDGVLVSWLDDDMMISMRYAAHLAQGWGLCWNPGEPPVEGYTNFLWVLVMTLPHLAGVHFTRTSLVILGLQGLLLIGVLWTAWRLGRRLGLSPGPRCLGLLFIASNQWFMYWTFGGSEATLLALMMLAAAVSLLSARRHRPAGWPAGVLLGLLGLVRADATVYMVPLLGLWASQARRRRTRPWAWTPALMLPVAYMVGRRLYYGHWVPNTYDLRMLEVPTRIVFGVQYVSDWMVVFGGVLVLLLICLMTHRHAQVRWLCAVPLVGLCYTAYAGGDELPNNRFIAPHVPLIFMLASAGLDRALRAASGWSRLPELRFAAFLLLMAVASYAALILPDRLDRFGRDRGQSERKNVKIGLLLKQNTQPEARVAHFWAGAAPYFSQRPALDFLGKNDPHIARLKAPPNEYMPGHNKHDGAYIFRQQPDVVVAPTSGDAILTPGVLDQLTRRKDYPGLFLPLANPRFWQQYSGNLVDLPISHRFHGLFVREGTTLAEDPAQWDALDLKSSTPRSTVPARLGYDGYLNPKGAPWNGERVFTVASETKDQYMLEFCAGPAGRVNKPRSHGGRSALTRP